MEAVSNAGRVEEKIQRDGGEAGADVKMIARAQIREIVLEKVGSARKRHEIGRGSQDDLDLRSRPTGRARVNIELGLVHTKGEVSGHHAIRRLQSRIGVDLVYETLSKHSDVRITRSICDAERDMNPIGLEHIQLHPIAIAGRIRD